MSDGLLWFTFLLIVLPLGCADSLGHLLSTSLISVYICRFVHFASTKCALDHPFTFVELAYCDKS
jgi:hypothetical protein